jgi:hypothetical protein
VREAVRDTVGDITVRDTVGDTVREAVRDTVGETVRDTVEDTVRGTVRHGVRDGEGDTVGDTSTHRRDTARQTYLAHHHGVHRLQVGRVGHEPYCEQARLLLRVGVGAGPHCLLAVRREGDLPRHAQVVLDVAHVELRL